ncbi:MAG: energy transducer TonB [Bdellovibrionota bacterium]
MKNDFENQHASFSVLWGLVLSIGIHLMLLFVQLQQAAPFQVPPSESPPIEISEVPEEFRNVPRPQDLKVRKRQEPEIAESEDAGNRVLDPNATILSDKSQTAEQQMKAKQVDDFRKGTGTGPKEKEVEGPKGLTPTGDPDHTADATSPLEVEDGIGVAEKKGVKRDWQTLSLKDLSVGGDGGLTSATDDYLQEVIEGDRTVLSTREFRYFSYYHRIKELLRQYWKPTVERKLSMHWAKGGTIRSEEMTTQLLILLNTKGEIAKISRVGSSGITDVDAAAVEAFHKAAPFPNPPRGIIDSDGFVRIRWDFILKAQATPKIQFQRNPATPRPLR